MNKYYNALEFNVILDRLKSKTIIESNKDLIDNIVLSNDYDEVNQMLCETDEATKLIMRMGRLEISFQKDIIYLVNKACKGVVLTIDELLEIGRFLDSSKHAIVYYKNLESSEIKADYLKPYIDSIVYSKELNLRLKEVFNNFGEIQDNASSTLFQIRKQISDYEKNINAKLNEIVSKNISKLTSSVVTMRNDRFVIPVKNDYKNQIKGFIHDTSSSGETVFIEPLVIFEMNNKLNSLYEDEKQEIHRILYELSVMVSENEEAIRASYVVMCSLDLIFTKAELSIELNGVKPKINNDGFVELYNCYHPLLNVPKIVKNDIIIGKDYKCIIITGPNTGGKTVLLKTIGLLSLMIKAGILIPCSEKSNICVFEDVFVDIGDEQSISQNLSTFSSHMKNVVDIMNKVNTKSLVLLDELGSGTDPTEGASLAISILDYLLKRNCLIIASSHYAELKIHAYESKNMINASVEFNAETFTPTYKLLIGVPGQSNALKICRNLGLKDEIIDEAIKKAYSSSSEINQTLDKLIQKSVDLEKKLSEARDKEYRLSVKLDEIDTLKEKINKERKVILDEAHAKALEIITKNEKEIKSILDDLKEIKNSNIKGHELVEISHRLNQIKDENNIKEEKVFNLNREIKENDKVFIEKYNTYGTVIKINNNKYLVEVGNASMTLKKEDLELTNVEIKPAIVPKANKIISTPRKTVSNRLDLRGMRYEEAEPLISKFISDCHYAGLNQVSIIHGFGTGVIRELVQSKLRANKLVKSFRYGGQNEGGQGATIVDL